LNYEVEIYPLLKKDSLDMNDEDREKIKKFIESRKEKNIIIFHWTDTMIDTAKVLQNIKDKTIVLFWSSLPEIFKNTDAHFNFGFALGVLKTIKEKGVYICMNWEVFKPDQVEKCEDGVFRKVL